MFGRIWSSGAAVAIMVAAGAVSPAQAAGDLLVKAVLARLRGTDLPDRRVPVQLLVRNSCSA